MTAAGLKSKRIPKTSEKGTSSHPATGWFSQPQKRAMVLGVALVIATLVLYFPAIHHPFVNYDDDGYVTNNLHVQAGLTWDTVAWAFTSFDQANWHPVTWLSHALDWQFFQLDPAGHHGTNLLLHAVNAALLFWILVQATGFTGRSFMVAALFALHPINVESVVWVAERKNLLSMLFLLLALGAYRWYARQPQPGRYAVIAVLFTLGLMAKPQIVTLPFVLLLWDYWPLQRMLVGDEHAEAGKDAAFPPKSFLNLLLEKLPLVALSAISAAITVKAQQHGGLNPELSFSARIANAIVSYARYAGKAFWPARLAPMYPHPGNSLAKPEVFAALLFLLVVTALVFAARRRRYLPVGWLWFLGTLIPMIGLVQVGRQAMADRYAYLPFIGLFIMICWGVADCVVTLSRSLASRRGEPTLVSASPAPTRISTVLMAAICAGVLLALAPMTHRQIDYWGDNVTLWSHTLQVTNRNYEAEEDLGEALLAKGEQIDAMPHFYRATEIEPRRYLPHMYIAVYDQEHGNLLDAIAQYRKVLSESQNSSANAQAFANMGHAYLQLGDMAQARESSQAAVALDPHKIDAWMDLGLAKQKSGDLSGATLAYSEGLKIKPSDVGYLLLAGALERSHRSDEAAAAMQRAKALSTNLAHAQRVADGLLAQ